VAVNDYDQLSVPELAQRLASTTQALVQAEIALAKQEAREDLRVTIRGAILIALGAGLLLFATICLLVALTSATAALLNWPLWGAALLWVLIFAVIGAICLVLGRQRIQTNPLSRTRASLKEVEQWARQRLTPPAR
jgi:uncharacterized membrane protein YqjE